MSLVDPQLLAFQKIAEIGTVHGAATALHLTQTAITQRLRGLEQRLKTTLFIRSRRGMSLTNEGKILYRYCQRVSELSGETLAKIQGHSSLIQSRVIIAGPNSIMRSRIIPSCQAIITKFNSLFFTFIIDDEEDVSHYLKSGKVDFAVLKPEQVKLEMQSKPLIPEQYVLVGSTKWKNRKLIEIIKEEKIIDFNPTDQMTFQYLQNFNLLEHAQNERHFVNNTESIAELFIEGLGYGVLTKEFAYPYIKSGKLMILNQGKMYANLLTLTWYDRPEPPCYFSKLINLIK